MKCPSCKIEMRYITRMMEETYKGKKVIVTYKAFRCPRCSSIYVDAKSLDESWARIREEHG